MDESLHKDDGLAAWVPPKEDLFWRFNPEGAYATLFRHPWYTDHDQYPNGVADMAGYWAESRIFGGVVLFDRRSPDSAPDVQKDSVWFHPDREDVTYRIVQLSEDQKQQLLGFLTSDSPSPSLLPILVDGENTRREDPEEPLHDTGIYRDLWERKPMGPDDIDRRLRDVWDTVEYPSMSDFERAQERAYDRKDML
ncbi:hypothetical protein CGCTS75_v013758 [Colletotrichum tropicale]|nr:hypothetical protein CGCTS75_v013758 [Colletotrichum tropicale]